MFDYYLLEQLTIFGKTGALKKTGAAVHIGQRCVGRELRL